jgi:hypothetical protein
VGKHQSNATWNGGLFPGPSDDVVFACNRAPLTLSTTVQVNSVTLSGACGAGPFVTSFVIAAGGELSAALVNTSDDASVYLD